MRRTFSAPLIGLLGCMALVVYVWIQDAVQSPPRAPSFTLTAPAESAVLVLPPPPVRSAAPKPSAEVRPTAPESASN